MPKKLATSLALLVLLAAAAHAGIRGPGKYRGVVIFDRWDTCYIYDGVYLMYVAETEKERLRRFEGQHVEVYAKKVVQPMNPGDARIIEFELLSSSAPKPPGARFKNLTVTAEPLFEAGLKPRFALVVRNRGRDDVRVKQFLISPTLLGEKDEADIFSPSDGKSEARITRCGLDSAKRFYRERGVEVTGADGRKTMVTRRYSFAVEDDRSLPDELLIPAGQSLRVVVSLDVPPGAYDFLFGCDVGILENRQIASNVVSFEVGDDGSVSFLNNRTLDTDTDENSNP
ncbi:MAG TPA: hypothetical protein VF521_18780 [Pyrinomonadaceae bacterium]